MRNCRDHHIDKALVQQWHDRMHEIVTEIGQRLDAATYDAPDSAGGGGVEAGVAQTGSEGPSSGPVTDGGNREPGRASGEEQRPSKPLVPGSIPGPSLDPAHRSSEASPPQCECGVYLYCPKDHKCQRTTEAAPKVPCEYCGELDSPSRVGPRHGCRLFTGEEPYDRACDYCRSARGPRGCECPRTDYPSPTHLARVPFRPVCGADKPNQHTAENPAIVTCLACLRAACSETAPTKCERCGVDEGRGHAPGCPLVEERLGDLLADDIDRAMSKRKSIVGKRYPLSDEAVAKISTALDAQRRVFAAARSVVALFPHSGPSEGDTRIRELSNALDAMDQAVPTGSVEK